MKNRIKSLLLVGILSGQLCAGETSLGIQAQDDVTKVENVTLRGRVVGHCTAFQKKITKTASTVISALKANPVGTLWGAVGIIFLAEMCARMVSGPAVTKAAVVAALRKELHNLERTEIERIGAAVSECSVCLEEKIDREGCNGDIQGMVDREGYNSNIALSCGHKACLTCLREIIALGLDKTQNPFPCPLCRKVFGKEDVRNIAPQSCVNPVERVIAKARPRV